MFFVTTYMIGGRLTCIQISLGWRISRSYLTITCKINNLQLPVYFRDPYDAEVGYCLQPTNASDCKITDASHRNYKIKQNLSTNETILIVKGIIDRRINGNWTCKHGSQKEMEKVEVFVLDIKEQDKAEDKRSLCYITLIVMLSVPIGLSICTYLTLRCVDMINERAMVRDPLNDEIVSEKIGKKIDRLHGELLKKCNRKQSGWLSITGLKLYTLILMIILALAVAVAVGNCTVQVVFIPLAIINGILIVLIIWRNGESVSINNDTCVHQQQAVENEGTQLMGEGDNSINLQDSNLCNETFV